MSTQCPAGSAPYVIKSGDTYFQLAKTFSTTIAAITAANPGVDPNKLQVGQSICLPSMPIPPVGCPPGSKTYTVKAGDTYFQLAKTFSTTIAAITAANPGVDPNMLQIGQSICLPGMPIPPVGCPPGSNAYTVKAGDTLSQIEVTLKLPRGILLIANPGVNPRNLTIGQILCIPPFPTCPTNSIPVIITKGQTLYTLAKINGITVEEILAANPGLDPNNLQVGQIICIPLRK